MKRYLGKLDKIENEDYFVMRSLSIDTVDTKKFLFSKSNNQFEDNTLYKIDYDEQNESTHTTPIHTWEDLEGHIQPYSSKNADNNLYERLRRYIDNKKPIGLVIDIARELFLQKSDEASYWPDIEGDVYDLLKDNSSDVSLWREAINHDREIFNYALSQEDWEFIVKYIENISIIFDIEGNAHKGTGREYAYFTVEEPNAKESLKRGDQTLNEDQWKKIEEAIKQKEIIIGHNIRLWDLILLQKRNEYFGSPEKYKSKIWDTMEIEILLNPSRPCFALNAENGHKAANDVRDNKKLFRQQLYMILGSEKLYERAKPFLPKDFVSVIETSKEFIFSSDINSKIISRYNEDEHNSLFYKPANIILPFELDVSNAKTLIIANKHFWQSIFEKYTPNFKCSDESLDIYNRIDVNGITKEYREPHNVYEAGLKAIADCYIAQGKPLNIKQIPKIIRKNIKDSILRQFVETTKDTDSKVICIDPHNVQDILDTERVYILDNFGLPEVLKIQLSEEQITKITSSVDDYSEQVAHLQLNSEQISELGIPICQYKKYWLTQVEPHAFVILCEISGKELEDYIKKRYSIAAINLIHKDNKDKKFDNKNEDIADIDEQEILSPTEYWGKRVEKLRTTKTDFAKIFVVDTLVQASSVNRYLDNNIEHKRTHQILDKAQEDKKYIGVLALESLRQNQGNELFDFDIPFTFILNDSKLISTSKENNEIKKSVENLKQELSIWGEGSEVFLLDEIKSSSEEYDQGRAETCFAKDEKPLLTIDDFEDVKKFIFEKYGYKEFRNVQEPAIKNIISNEGQNHLIIVPTSGGKSTIFQGPILYKACKQNSHKLSVVITPLQALMEDQVNELINKYHFDKSLIAFINANTSYKKRNEIIGSIRKHELALLYISPEKLMTQSFFKKVINRAANEQGIDSIIFDEAHCITAWGMDFRSDYIFALRKCLELQKAHKGITIQMFTATLPWQSKEDLKAEIQFGEEDCNILPSPDSDEYKKSLCPIRDHIELQIVNTEADKKEEANSKKLESIIKTLDNPAIDNLISGRSRMIVFTYSRSDAEESAEWLKEHIQNDFLKEKISYFHARIESHEKECKIRQFKDGQILILCTTKAFGLGMNIPNIHYVFHLTPPTYIEDYLQEVGRAARKTDDPYMDAFPIVNGKREPVKAICYYTKYDIENRLDRIQRILWDDVHDSFEEIKKYKSHFENPNGRYLIPINILELKENTDCEPENKSNKEDLIEKFQQCLGWLSKTEGLNRIKLGFKCPDSYDLGYAPNISGISEGSQLYKLIEYLKENNVNLPTSKRVIVQANSVISNPALGIDSIEDLESIIDEGVRLGVFNRDFMYISISLKNKKYLMDFIEERTDELDVLSVLCESLKDRRIDNFNLTHSLDEKLDNISKEKQISDKKREYIKSVIAESWNFFVDLNKIYTADEIEANYKNLIREIGQSKTESVSWSTMEKAVNAQADTNKLKLFLYGTSKLSYTTKGSANTDFIEISISNEAELDENIDSEAKKEINNFYLNKQSRAGAMCGLLEEFKDSESTKKFIREYSACPTDKIDELEIVARDKSRVSARKGLEDAVTTELNGEQLKIYNLPANQNINVIAGAGSGKTRLLIYRALKLILDEGNNESKVLILAYNRAVRDEVEKRMAEYASSIRCPLNDMKIYTFHGYASICIPDLQNNKVNFDEWERSLLQDIKDNPEKYKNKYRHILIDEFQDVTTTRLEIIKSLLTLNTPCNAFVIGDMFQSIYGYEKKKDDRRSSIEPLDYYSQLDDIGFSCHNLSSNYRSYQAIINTAQQWFEGMKLEYTEKYKGRVPNLRSELEKDKYVQIDDNDKGKIPCMTGNDWKGDFFEKIFTPFINNRYDWAKNNNGQNPFSSIGILFRTNSDVQDAFQWLNDQKFIKDNNIEVRIQGSDIFYYSTREFYFFEKRLAEMHATESIEQTIDNICDEMLAYDDAYDKDILEVARNLAKYVLKRNENSNISCKNWQKNLIFSHELKEIVLKRHLTEKMMKTLT